MAEPLEINISKSFVEHGGKQWATYENGGGVTVQVWKNQQLELQRDLSYTDYATFREKAPELGLRDYPAPLMRRQGGTNANGNTLGRVVGETAPTAVPATQANAAIEAETQEESITGEHVLDGLQLGLDVVGLIPVVGEAADIISAGISLARGDYVGAGLSLLSAIPFVGYAGTAGKATRYGAKMAEASGKVGKEAAEKKAKNGAKILKPRKLKAGTPEHKSDRWNQYQEREGKKDYEAWSKQYDTNIRNYQYGLAREKAYRKAMGASEGSLKTPATNRQIDILKEKNLYAGQLKTGRVSLTKENQIAIKKDAFLVKDGWEVEHILEKGASKPYLDALEKAGINYKTTPQIPH